MNPQSIVLAMALLTAGAPSYGQAVTPGGPQDFESIMKSMEKAQAEASQPGDQQLTCPPARAAENQAKVAQGAAGMQSR